MLQGLPNIRVLADHREVARHAAQLFSDSAQEAVSTRGRFVVAFSGGRTPRRFFEVLAGGPYREQIPWEAVHVFMVDERLVSPDDHQSNFGVLKRLLLNHVGVEDENVHPYSTGLSAEAASREYSQLLESTLGSDGLDLVLLGMGEDGHVASIFPGTEALYVDRRGAVAQMVPQVGAWRLSLTLPEINTAKSAVFLVTGSDKACALADVATGRSGLPAERVSPRAGELLWLVDEAAASRLHSPADEHQPGAASLSRGSGGDTTSTPTDLRQPDSPSPKQLAGEAAALEVQSGMAIGLGTGSTARYATVKIGQELAEGRISDVVAVPTSEATAGLAQEHGIRLVTLAERPRLDLAIDGADEVSPGLDLIKGLGAALVREKIVAAASERFLVVADVGKRVDRLGTKAPLPVAVIPFGWTATREALLELGADPRLRQRENEPVVTDDGLYLLDCRWEEGIVAPDQLDAALRAIPGVVETGLFLGMAATAYLADENDVVELHRH